MRLILTILSFAISLTATSQTRWKLYEGKSDGLSLAFRYPSTTRVRSTENGICIDEIKKAAYPTKWCFWFYDKSDATLIDTFIADARELASKATSISERRDTLSIAGYKSLHLILTDIKANSILVEMIFLIAGELMIEIESWRPEKDIFTMFLRSIVIK